MKAPERLRQALTNSLRELVSGEPVALHTLAAIFLMSKNEKVLCRLLEYQLRRRLQSHPGTTVCREWRQQKEHKKMQRFDLAVLQDGCAAPITLVEAKAAYAWEVVKGHRRRKPIANLGKDVADDREKLKQASGGWPGCDQYVLVFLLRNRRNPEDPCKLLQDYGDLSHATCFDDGEIQPAFEFCCQCWDIEIVPDGFGEVPAGNAFGTDVSVFYGLLEVR